jgi:hypothetical protein
MKYLWTLSNLDIIMIASITRFGHAAYFHHSCSSVKLSCISHINTFSAPKFRTLHDSTPLHRWAK